MTQSEKVKAARQFAEAWKGRGYEKGDAQVFWTELLRDLIGMEHVSFNAKFEYWTVDGGFIDYLISDAAVFVEQKGLSIDLSRPEEPEGGWSRRSSRRLPMRRVSGATSNRASSLCAISELSVCDRNAHSRKKPGDKNKMLVVMQWQLDSGMIPRERYCL